MTATTPVVRLGSPGQLVAAVPYLLGFVPRDSAVVITARGARHRVGLTLRVDLAVPDNDEVLGCWLAERARHEQPTSCLAVVYTDEPDDDGTPPRHRLVAALHSVLGERLHEAVLVRDERWRSYLCSDSICCPPAGTPINPSSTAATAIAAAHVMAGHQVLPDRAALVATMRPLGGIAAASMAQAVARAEPAFDALTRTERRRRSAAVLDTAIGRYRDPRARVDDNEAAWLQLGWCDIRTRDAVLLHSADRGTLRRLVIDVARRTLPELRAPAYSLAAWFAYADGDGVLARTALDLATAADPAYSLAGLLSDALDRQLPPAALVAAVQPGRRDRSGRSAAP